jgi:cytochrome c-type biogenesis protein CcmH
LRELEADLDAGTIDQAAYENARHELERRVAEEVQPQAVPSAVAGGKRWSAVAVGIAVPVLSISIYLLVGSPEAFDPTQQTAAQQQNAHEITPEQIEGMVASLAQRLQNEPDNAEGWNMLARSYAALGRYPQAAQAYARLVQLVPNDAALLADYADTLAMAQNRSLQGEPEKIITRAVQADPKNLKALALWGTAAFERKDYANAVTRWQQILPLVPADSDAARSTSNSIAEAQSLMGQPPVALGKPASTSVVGGTQVAGMVELDPALRSQVADTDTVFIFARAAEGPRFPLAVLRKQVKDLPVKFVLDDSMSMMPEARLSTVPMVVVGARISKSGSATPAAGDLEGLTEPVAPGATNLKIRINKRNG